MSEVCVTVPSVLVPGAIPVWAEIGAVLLVVLLVLAVVPKMPRTGVNFHGQ